MKAILDQDLVLSLTVERKPTKIVGKKITESVLNPTRTAYIIFDAHQKAPVGFGVRVAGAKQTQITYVVQKKVHGKVIKAKVGGLRDYNLVAAREAARTVAQVMIETGQNPNALKRQQAKEGITLAQCFDSYHVYLTEDKKPKATKNTLASVKKARAKLASWENIKVSELDPDKIKARFREIFAKTPTTAEQTFRWARVAVQRELKEEERRAKLTKREPFLTLNPFDVLNELYRNKKQLDADIKAGGRRKPLSVRGGTLSPFLEAVWARRKENRTGCDYILCCLLWGTRKSEAAALRWRDQITASQALTCSWVDMAERKVFFYDTKTRSNHELPICDSAFQILRQRREMMDERHPSKAIWVFPARSRFSKTGHYTDGRSLLEYICEDAGIERRGFHDFRRTFATAAEELCSWGMLKRLLGHFDHSESTGRYPEYEWSRIAENLQRIELHLLAAAPSVYNALLASQQYAPIV